MGINLTQGSRGAILDWRDDGVVDRITDSGTISREQNVDEILRETADARSTDMFRGFRLAPTFRRVASIPVAVVDLYKAHGIDLLSDKSAMRQFLNDRDNRAFRTTTERV